MAVKEFELLVGSLVAKMNKDGTKTQRFRRNTNTTEPTLVKLDDAFVDVKRLVELGAIGNKGDKKNRRPTAAGLAYKANEATGNPQPTPTPEGGFIAPAPDEADVTAQQVAANDPNRQGTPTGGASSNSETGGPGDAGGGAEPTK